MSSWKGIYNTNKKTNKKIAMAILLALFLQAVGLFPALGFDLASPMLGGFAILSILNIGGTLWIMYGLHKYKIGS